jgi:hypothetical protein
VHTHELSIRALRVTELLDQIDPGYRVKVERFQDAIGHQIGAQFVIEMAQKMVV